MGPFACIEDMWQNLSFCPICKEFCRKIDLSVGLDTHFSLLSFSKDENELEIKSYLTINYKKYMTIFKLNCLNDKYIFDIYSATSLEEVTISDFQIYFYFYMQSFCDVCDSASAYSSDIELDNTTNVVTNIGLESENFTLRKQNEVYKVTLDYLEDRMYVLPYNEEPFYKEKEFKYPIISLDVSNQEKAVDKIKTLILLS